MSSTKLRPWLPLLLWALAAPAAHADDELVLFANEARIGLSTDDLVVHRMDDEFYTESWYFMGVGDDGTHLFVHYGFTNAGFGSFTGAIEVTLLTPKGKILFDKTQIDSDDVRYRQDRLEIDFAGAHRLEGDGRRYRLRSKGEKVAFDLAVSAIAPGLKFGDGKVWFDDDREEFYALVILTPRAWIEGTLQVGERRIPFRGYGYADHAWQNYPAHKMADRLYSVRGFDQEHGFSYLVFETPFGKPIATLVVAEGDRIAYASARVRHQGADFETDPEIDDYRIPRRLGLEAESSRGKLRGTVRFTRLLQRQDAVQDFNFFERTLIKMFVAKPILYRYDATYELAYPRAGSATTRSGDAVVEAMILRAD